MRHRVRAWTFPLAAAALVLAAGCGGNSKFVYKPGPPGAGGAQLPAKVAVLAFKDGTADFKQSGSIFGRGQFNLVKTGIAGISDALTPEFWAKSFADDLAASGAFRSARFLYGASELVDEEFFVEGTVKKVYGAISLEDLNEIELDLRAVRSADNRLLWEKRVAREWKTSPDIVKGCGASMACVAERCHEDMNARMQAIFAEARADLARTVGSRSGNGDEAGDLRDGPSAAGEAVEAKPPAQTSPESAERTIERILKGQ